MQYKAQIAGILTIIAGGFGILWLVGAWLGLYMVMYMFSNPYYGDLPREFFTMMNAMYLSYGVFGAVLGILGIIGGIFALKRKRWGWALAGAIAGVITFFPTGVAAIILLSMGRAEFKSSGHIIPQNNTEIKREV